MFKGIIEEIGIVRSIITGRRSAVLEIQAKKILEGVTIGDSIATNGVCLTVTSINDVGFTVDVMPETLKRSSLGNLTSGSKVNLERAIKADGRFGGHIVSGHVDACGKVLSVDRDDNAILLKVSVPTELLRFIAIKGSVTLDGTSVTVMDADRKSFTVSLIPHTCSVTTLGLLKPGSPVNVEVDVIARYIERLLSFDSKKDAEPEKQGGLSLEYLIENGF